MILLHLNDAYLTEIFINESRIEKIEKSGHGGTIITMFSGEKANFNETIGEVVFKINEKGEKMK